MPTPSAPAQPSSRERLRWILGWVVLPLLVIAMLFAAGVHVGARRPDKPLARALLWAFGGEAGVRHGTALTGSWRVDDFEFVVDASNLRVNEFSRHLGLVLLLDSNVEYAPAARITIRAACSGSCEYAKFEARLRGEVGEHEFEQIAESKGQPVDRVEWVQRPTKLRGGGWWWRMQSFDESGSLVADDASIAFLDPRADRYLHCRVEVMDPYLDRAEELIDVCKDLEWRIAGPDAPPMEARFGGKYEVSGLELAIPTPPADFEFNTYRPGHEVRFHGVESARPSTFSISSGCFGHCDPATLREEALKRLQAELVEDTVLTKDFDVVHQVEEIAPHRWRNRMRHEELLVRGTVVAIRPGADDWIECQFWLWKSAHDRADEFEALCLELLADW